MDNTYQTKLAWNPFHCNEKLTAECLAYVRKLHFKARLGYLLRNLSGLISQCVAALIVSAVLLGGIYVFLSQLACYGW